MRNYGTSVKRIKLEYLCQEYALRFNFLIHGKANLNLTVHRFYQSTTIYFK